MYANATKEPTLLSGGEKCLGRVEPTGKFPTQNRSAERRYEPMWEARWHRAESALATSNIRATLQAIA